MTTTTPDLTRGRALAAAAILVVVGRADLADAIQHGTDRRHETPPPDTEQEDHHG